MNIENRDNKTSKTLIAGLVFVAICLAGTYAALFVPASVGSSPRPISGYASIFCSTLFFSLLWKYLRKKTFVGLVFGIIIGVFSFYGAGVLAGYQKASSQSIESTSTQTNTSLEWTQGELTESYMRSISKNMCIIKTIEFLKKCDSNDCIKTMAGVSGDCVTFSKGSIKDFCETYKQNFVRPYCDASILSRNACKVIQVAEQVHCKH